MLCVLCVCRVLYGVCVVLFVVYVVFGACVCVRCCMCVYVVVFDVYVYVW